MNSDIGNSFTVDFLEAIRLAELTQIEGILSNTVPAGAKILEIGAGTGWQARKLAARGYFVSAIDIPTSNHGNSRIWPIMDFDGRFIPFPDHSFDIVYSSNVLEHVEDFESLNKEIARVLRSNGTAIHYVPTSAWRAWSLAAFYPALARDLFKRVYDMLSVSYRGATQSAFGTVPGLNVQRSFLRKFLYRIVPHAHGAFGTCWTELFRFSRKSWDEVFSSSGWTVTAHTSNRLFLTGDMIFGERITTARRQRLSHIFGSTAHLYVLKYRQDKK